MELVTLAQVVTSVTNLLFVVVLAAGYYFTWRVSQQTLGEMREQRTAMGRPLVIVQENYDDLPELDVAIRNVSGGAASQGHNLRVLRTARELGRLRHLGPAVLQGQARLPAAARRAQLLLGRPEQPDPLPRSAEPP